MRNIFYTMVGVLSVFLLWIILSYIYPPAIIPKISQIFTSLVDIISQERFLLDLGNTMVRIAGSFFIAMFAGVLLGIVAGIWLPVSEALHPVMVMAESAPPMAWLVMAILFLGMGHGPSLMVGLSAAVPVFFFNTVMAMRGIDQNLIEMARSYRVPFRKIVTSIYLPGILLSIVGAASSSLSIIWRVVIMAEAFTTAKGLGPQLWGSYLYSESAPVYAYIFIIVFFGFILEYGVIRPGAGLVKKRLRVVENET